MFEDDELNTLQAKVDLERGFVEMLQAEYNQVLNELRILQAQASVS